MRIAVIGSGGVGRALSVILPPDLQTRLEKTVLNFPPMMKPSMAVDLEHGNRLELPWLGGKVVALGKQLGVPSTRSVTYPASQTPRPLQDGFITANASIARPARRYVSRAPAAPSAGESFASSG